MKPEPVIGITLGDAAGIGPEIVLKALMSGDVRAKCIVVGDAAAFSSVAASLGIATDVHRFEIHDLKNLPEHFAIGLDAAVTGKAAAENILAAVELWRGGKIDAVCTAPISKKAINMGGYDYPGHTEMLAELTGT